MSLSSEALFEILIINVAGCLGQNVVSERHIQWNRNMGGGAALLIASIWGVATAFDVENATDYPGHDIIRPPKEVPNYTACEEMCVANSNCAGEV